MFGKVYGINAQFAVVLRLRDLRIARFKREAASYVILRKKGVSINQIAQIGGRSTSMVYRILARNGLTGARMDLRKLPARIKLLAAQRARFRMVKLWSAWEAFILGEGEKPP